MKPNDLAVIASEIEHTYVSPAERAAYRAGMSSAAAICDRIASDTKLANTSRGRVTNAGKALAAVATACGDEITSARECVKCKRTDRPTPNPSEDNDGH